LLALTLKTVFWIAVFNFGLFVCSIWIASRIRGVNPWIFSVLLALNAETAVSITTLNKESLASFAIVLFAYYVYSRNRSFILLLIILSVSLCARWEQVAIILLYLALARKGSYFSTRPKLAIFFVVMLLSVMYPLLLHSADVDLSGFTSQAEGGNTIVFLNTLQSHYAFVIAVAPKILMNVLGQLASPSYFFSQWWSGDFNDIQNQFVIHLHEFAMLAVSVAILIRKRWKLSNPIPYFVALYLIMTAVTPFIQPRYEYPVYVLLCLELVRKEASPVINLSKIECV
jgi:hypothetical protein